MMAASPAPTMRDAQLVASEILLPKPKRFMRETLRLPDGHEIDWYYVDTPPSVMVVPVTAEGSLVLVRQYRHNLQSYALELPAGMISEREAPEKAALRELEEETGFTLAAQAKLHPLGALLLAAIGDEQIHPRLPCAASRASRRTCARHGDREVFRHERRRAAAGHRVRFDRGHDQGHGDRRRADAGT